jgi:dihydroxyacetone kinase-like protein
MIKIRGFSKCVYFLNRYEGKMKKFVNDPFDLVDEMLEGFISVHGNKIRKLQDVRSIARIDAPVAGKVGIVSGGGSGHKPAFIGFCGKGMLDSVAVGEIFTSPPPMACYEAVKAVDSGKGVLIHLGNYAGDVMNFQMSAELSAADGINVEQVVLTDDVASAPKGEEQRRRGVSGAFLCWKVAGAKAEAGGSLAECKAVVEKVNANTRTIGVALSPCTVPAKGTPTFTLADDEMEYGVGHHGEPGTERIKILSLDDTVTKMMSEILADLPFKKGDDVAVVINGLGSTPQIELYAAFRKVKSILDGEGIAILNSFVGEFFTGLEMAGFSITISKLDSEIQTLLDAPADTACYKK